MTSGKVTYKDIVSISTHSLGWPHAPIYHGSYIHTKEGSIYCDGVATSDLLKVIKENREMCIGSLPKNWEGGVPAVWKNGRKVAP